MSEEENKVFETLKKGYGLTKAETEIISNLIDKQQKEIEELIAMKPLQELIDTNVIIADYSHNYISKDKIREKIKKAKEIKWHIPKLVIEYFEELLKEK